MTTLCPTCATEHATDAVRVECSKRGFVQPQTECPQYKPTREKQLEDALANLVESLEGIDLRSRKREELLAVYTAVEVSRERLGKA